MLFTVTGVVAESVTNMQYQVSEFGDTLLNEALPEVNEDSVWTRTLPVLHAELEDEYSLAV